MLRQDFAVILLDVQMPVMSGLETAALIRRRKRSAHTPIIFLTAFADEVRIAEGYAQGAVDYITTPVVPTVLRAKVRVFCDLYRMTQQVRRQAEERIALAEERTKREAAEEANRRLAFLAEASRVLAGSLDPQATAQRPGPAGGPQPRRPRRANPGTRPKPPLADRTGLGSPPDQAVHTRWLASEEAPADELRATIDRVLATGDADQLDGLDIPYPTLLDCPAPPGHRLARPRSSPSRPAGERSGS